MTKQIGLRITKMFANRRLQRKQQPQQLLTAIMVVIVVGEEAHVTTVEELGVIGDPNLNHLSNSVRRGSRLAQLVKDEAVTAAEKRI